MSSPALTLLNDVAAALHDSLTRLPGRMVPDTSGLTIQQRKALGPSYGPGYGALPKVERRPQMHSIEEVRVFQQSWGSTALGFGGMGGGAITEANVVLVGHEGWYAVYFGGRFAYIAPKGPVLEHDIITQRMADVAVAKTKYNPA